MTDLRKAAEMALEALEFSLPAIEDFGSKEQLTDCHRAIMALYKSLAQPEQSCSCGEPDALGVIHRKDSPCYVAQNPLDIADRAYFAGKQAGIVETLAKPEQEPVAWVKDGKERVGFGRIEERKYVQFDQTLPVGTKLYTAPISKPWVSLTMKDYHKFLKLGGFEAFKAIEAALRSKNT